MLSSGQTFIIAEAGVNHNGSLEKALALNAARRSLVAARTVRAGELWTIENLTCKRPGNGAPPIEFWDYLGKPASRDYKADELLQP
jgi:sialic acid synthase SpsE